MRIIETKVYKFNELSEQAKEKAIEKLIDINVGNNWWEHNYEDAKNVGINITSFDIDRGNVLGDFIDSALETATAIISEHGIQCQTYKTAKRYYDNLLNFKNEDAEFEFKVDILSDYLDLLQEEFEYQTSKEAIIETIEANDYEFTEDGKLI